MNKFYSLNDDVRCTPNNKLVFVHELLGIYELNLRQVTFQHSSKLNFTKAGQWVDSGASKTFSFLKNCTEVRSRRNLLQQRLLTSASGNNQPFHNSKVVSMSW